MELIVVLALLCGMVAAVIVMSLKKRGSGIRPAEGESGSKELDDDGLLRLERDPYESGATEGEFAGTVACLEATQGQYVFGIERPCIEGVPMEYLRTSWDISFDALDMELYLRDGQVCLTVWRFPHVSVSDEAKSVTFYNASGEPIGTVASTSASIDVLVGNILTGDPRDPSTENRGPMRFVARFELVSGVVSHAFTVIDNNDYTATE